MKLIIDVVLLIIIALCTWGGYKKGVIGGIAGILAVVIAILGGSMLSSAYAYEAIPAFKPFVSGYMDSLSNREEILSRMGYSGSDFSLNDILEADPSLRYDYAYECMQRIGFYDTQAEELAKTVITLADTQNLDLTDTIVVVQCDTITYVIGLTIGFLLILILLIAAANTLNFSFRIPNMENLDEIGGAILGFVKSLLYCTLLSWFLSFLGLVIGQQTLAGTTLARFFLEFRFITGMLL